MSPRKTATPATPDWRREAAGTYRSADDRFTLEGDGAGRWFVRDEHETDELGLPRTTGPHATLAAAKQAATEQREHGPEPSPLAAALEASRRPGGANRGALADDGPRRAPKRPPPQTWLETLEATDRGAARRARATIRDLETLGIGDADDLVRRDVLGGQPEVAARLLAEAVRRAMGSELAPDALIDAAKGSGVRAPADVEAFAAFVVARTLGVALDVIVGQDRLHDAPSALPGWELQERGPDRRRIRLSPDDLA